MSDLFELNYRHKENQGRDLIVMLHGFGANMDDLYPLSEYSSQVQYDWVFPNAPLAAYPTMKSMRAWSPIDMMELQQKMSQGIDISFEQRFIKDLDKLKSSVISFISQFETRYENIIIGGFSQGAMLSAHLLNESNIKAGLLLSGVLANKDDLCLSRCSKKKVFQAHGKSDPVLAFSQGIKLCEYLELQYLEVNFNPFEGGHEIPMSILQQMDTFLENL